MQKGGPGPPLRQLHVQLDKSAAVLVRDAETGELCELNNLGAVDADSGLERPRPSSPSSGGGSKSGGAPLAPGDKAGAARLAQQLRAEQQQRLVELIAQEASRECLRREALDAERSAWRRGLMKSSFVSERIAFAETLKHERAGQEVALAARLSELGLLHIHK